jgi:hypothetical protein
MDMRWTSAVLAASLLVVSAASLADPAPVCRIGDDRLVELSGLAAVQGCYVVVNDGSDERDRRKIFFLDGRCKVTRSVAYPSRPRDTEDLALGADGTVWVADIGDNDSVRTTIALWRLPAGARKPNLYRMTYPDGAHNAEALLLAPDGTPIVVTKAVGAAGMYVPDGDLKPGGTTALRLAGSVTLPVTGTSNPYSFAGHLLITGGAVSPDGRRAVLRTYADAFEFDVPDGDVVRAVASGKPRVIALPDEPQGEAIAYTPDGGALLTVSEEKSGVPPQILRYPLTSSSVPSPSLSSPSSPSSAASSSEPSPSATSATRRVLLPAGALVAGLIVAGAAFVVAARRRNRQRPSRGPRRGPQRGK